MSTYTTAMQNFKLYAAYDTQQLQLQLLLLVIT